MKFEYTIVLQVPAMKEMEFDKMIELEVPMNPQDKKKNLEE
jgi:hypothetical protein